MVEKLFNIHLLHLQEITNHSINETKQNANLIIHLTKDSDYDRVINNETRSDINNIASEIHCMGIFETNDKGEIIKADIVLPLDHVFSKGLLVACIVEETSQVMGLPNDSDWVHPSIANDRSKVELLTGLDYLLLKILYSNKLKAGLSLAQSHGVIKDIIKQQQNSGVIKQAPFTVNQKGLNPYINH